MNNNNSFDLHLQTITVMQKFNKYKKEYFNCLKYGKKIYFYLFHENTIFNYCQGTKKFKI